MEEGGVGERDVVSEHVAATDAGDEDGEAAVETVGETGQAVHIDGDGGEVERRGGGGGGRAGG